MRVKHETAGSSHYLWQGGDLLLHVFVQPKASRDEIVGIQGNELKVRIKAAPVDGQANQQLIKFLAKSFKVPKSQVQILNGENSRHKRLRVQAPKQLPDVISPHNG